MFPFLRPFCLYAVMCNPPLLSPPHKNHRSSQPTDLLEEHLHAWNTIICAHPNIWDILRHHLNDVQALHVKSVVQLDRGDPPSPTYEVDSTRTDNQPSACWPLCRNDELRRLLGSDYAPCLHVALVTSLIKCNYSCRRNRYVKAQPHYKSVKMI